MPNPQNLEVFPDPTDGLALPGYSGPDRRLEMRKWRAQVDRNFEDVNKSFEAGTKKMDKLGIEIAENTASTKRIEADTSELVAMLKAAKGAIKVLNFIGSLAKPMAAIISLAVAIWGFVAIVKGGGAK